MCPPCAERAKTLRAAQCREGWHLEDEPGLPPGPASEDQQWWVTLRAEAQRDRDQAASAGQDPSDLDELITELDGEIAKAGIRGRAAPARTSRRRRSTRRRQDAPDLPKRKIDPRTVGRTYTAPDGKTFRPSLFVTLTCPGYGRVGQDGTPADPQAYDYDRAARDALAFAALFDRFIQNLRRYLGYDIQYFAAVEPQKRLAPHVHLAMRGTVARAEIRRVLAATYHQVWWPDTSAVRFDGDQLPVWDEATRNYLDPATGEVLPSWDQALDAIGKDDQPHHVARFGTRFDAQGVLAGSKDAARCIGYLTKYLTKQVGACHHAETDAERAHAAGLAEALRYQPCSPTCANWLRYGVQPKNPVRVARQLHERRGGGFASGPLKSEAGQRTVAIPELITPNLAAHIVAHARPGDDVLVFTSPAGGPLRPTNFWRRFWVPALRAAGLPPIHFHDLRHTGNMLAADAGANPRELMDRMGHFTARAAMMYLHGSNERQQAIADEVSRQAAELLGRSKTKPSGTQRHGGAGRHRDGVPDLR